MNFSEFITSKRRNAWIKEKGIDIYIRVSIPNRGTDFDLATLNAKRPGKGALTSFLDKHENSYTFYFENVLNERLREYLKRRGYRLVDEVNMCYSKPPKPEEP